MPSPARDWNRIADIAQESLDALYGTPEPQLFHNFLPVSEGSNDVFNYWWLAHVIDARLDAFERTGSSRWLEAAFLTRRNLLERNGGSLFNDYFDDMLWFALACLRLHDLSGDAACRDDAVSIWEHVIEHGWNDRGGESLAWRKQQLEYKNTPANAPLVILSARLAMRTGEARYLDYGRRALDWLDRVLVRPEDGFVEDGINREGDGRIDTQWRFTYNQGLYVGACIELDAAQSSHGRLPAAVRTALTAIDELSDGRVFLPEGDGGDEGLFKGVYYRYVELLRERMDVDDPARDRITRFMIDSSDALVDSALTLDGLLHAANDWREPARGAVPYSTQLSAIMAIEARAGIEAESVPA